MVDFHSHFLPEMDDGADSVETSLAMLRESSRQGVDLICATPHFYADEEDPKSFLRRRSEAYSRLREAMGDGKGYPDILLGAEVLYFPGISVAEEMRELCLEGTFFLLVEPPMLPWTDAMLDEIEACVSSLHCIPVIAHIDRYMRLLNDPSLLDRVSERKMLIQANAAFFLHRQSRTAALDSLRNGRIHFLGTDCHEMVDRPPNLGDALDVISDAGAEKNFERFNARVMQAIKKAAV